MIDQNYTISITDFSHYMETESEITRSYPTLPEAQAACHEIIDRSLTELYAPGMTSEELKKQFFIFGEQAACEGFDPAPYVAGKIAELCC